MAETAEQYIHRILAHVRDDDPIKVQAATPGALDRLLRTAPASALARRPAPERWSAREILAHLADVEIVVGWRVRSILAAPGTAIQSFDQDAWALSGHYDQRDVRKDLEQFRVLREANLALYRSLRPDQWKHHGMHAERGKETIEHIVRLIAGHDINHLKQIEPALAPGA